MRSITRKASAAKVAACLEPMDWNPAYYMLLTLAIGAVAVAITLLAAWLRVRVLWFTAASVLVCAALIGYFWQQATQVPTRSADQSATAPRSQQPAGESKAGRNTAATTGEASRAQEIQQSEHP